jgi:beta-N-acetylhexosaminidase
MTQTTLREHIGGLIMPRLDVGAFYASKESRENVEAYIRKGIVVGFCVFGTSWSQTQDLLTQLQQLRSENSSFPLLFSMDAEWGTAMRLKEGGTEYPHAMALAHTGDEMLVEEVAYANGIELHSLGVHWNFAPVADINSDPANPIINIRSFGETADEVIAYAAAYHRGLKRSGIISAAKHFPGHGNTHVDSHSSLPILEEGADAFRKLEILPFRKLMDQGIESIMLGHLAAPILAESLGAATRENAGLPATISPWLCNKLLREELRFNGVVITDSLEMAALTKIGLSNEKIASSTIIAGVDILLMPPDPKQTFDGILSSVGSGEIPEERIHESLTRIRVLHDFAQQNVPGTEESKYLNKSSRMELGIQAARNSLQVKGDIVRGIPPSSIIIFSSSNPGDISKIEVISKAFLSLLKVIRLVQGDQIATGDIQSSLFFVLDRPRGVLTEEKREKSISHSLGVFAEQAVVSGSMPLGVVLLGNPYLEKTVMKMKPKFLLHTYSDSLPSIIAAIELLKDHIL